MQPEEQQEFINEFVANAKDHLYAIEQGLLNLQVAKDLESIAQILRAVESLKVGAEMLGIKSIEKIAHQLRKYLENVRDYAIQVDENLEALFLKVFDSLHLLVNELESPFGLNEEFSDRVISEIRPVLQSLKKCFERIINPLVPFAKIEEIFPLSSAVINAATEYGKQAEVKIDGGETLIPESLLKHFPKLLTHLINNAIAHGIEIPEVRQAKGKSPVGQITLRIFDRDNQVKIEFSDDGAGIDIERVKVKAIKKGLITNFQAQTISRTEVYELLYHPGFSTKDERDMRAGLGFGMDVIRQELNKIGGVISTESIPDRGTLFNIFYFRSKSC